MRDYVGSGDAFLNELWHDLAGVSLPSEESRSPDELRRHVRAEDWEDEICSWSFEVSAAPPDAEKARYLVDCVLCTDPVNTFDCRMSGACGSDCLAAWCSFTGRTLTEAFAACDARMVQGMFRYGDAWHHLSVDWLRAFARDRLERFLAEEDAEMLLDAANGYRMAYLRITKGY